MNTTERGGSRSKEVGFRISNSLILLLTMLVGMSFAGFLASCSDDDDGAGPGDTKAPVIASVTPADGASKVSLNSDVVVTFSERVDAATCTPSSFVLDPPAAGTVSVDGLVVTFSPNDPLMAATQYEFTVAATVCDLAGNHMAEPFVSMFTTASQPVAVAGDDQFVNRSQTILLDASHSSGMSKKELSYSWTQLAGPTTPALSGATPSFSAPDAITTLVFSLVVSDDGIESEPDLIKVLVMEDKNHGYFVHPTGSDQNDGSINAPFVTIQAAIDAAVSENAGGDLYIAGGEYVGDVLLQPDISLYGGYHPDAWTRDEPFVATTIRGGTTAVSGFGAGNLTLDGLAIESANGSTYGESSIALLLDACTNVTVLRSHLMPGNGMLGLPGSDGRDGLPGLNGGNGSGRGGGAGGIGPGHPGGSGGTGGFDWESGSRGHDGVPDPPEGGLGGAGGGYNGTGHVGGNGLDAAPGADGPGGTAFGQWVGTEYVPAKGIRGEQRHGCGGGGGGGGGAEGVYNGGGGGGGGAGGEGGVGGEGGGGGGASIGIALLNGTVANIQNCIITTGDGGAGAWGGEGGAGAPGGTGGGSGAPQSDGFWLEGEHGGKGGVGGAGSKGGYGGGGGGGPVIGIFSHQSTGTRTQLQYHLGTPGAGGARLDGFGSVGDTGESSEYKNQI